MAPPATDRLAGVEDRLAELSRQPLAPADFFTRFLGELREVVAYRAAAVWGLNRQGVVERVAEFAAEQPLPPGSAKGRVHRVLEVLSTGQPRLSPDPAEGDHDFVTVLRPLHQGGRAIGVVEAAFNGEASRETLGSADETIARLARHAEAFIHGLLEASTPNTPPPNAPPPSKPPAGGLESAIVLRLHQTLSVPQTAMTVVNEGRTLLQADRVAVAITADKRTKIAAVSGRERVAANSASMKGLSEIASLVAATGRPCRFGGGAPPTDSPLDTALAEHAAESGAMVIEAVPLVPTDDDPDEPPPADRQPIGVLLIERFSPAAGASPEARLEPFAAHAAVALANARRHERLAGSLPGRLIDRFYGPREKPLAWRALAVGAIGVALLIAAGALPMAYRVEARGELSPAERSYVFAPTDAEVLEVVAHGGQAVEAGDVLLRLTSDRLAAEVSSLENQLRQQRRTLAALEAELAGSTGPTSEAAAARRHGRAAQTRIEIQGLAARLSEARREQQRLVIRAPHAGRVATFDPGRTLRRRPVARGEALLEVMRFEGPWRLRLDCPAGETGRVVRASRASHGAPLPVEFVLATRPEASYTAAVSRIATRMQRREGGRLVATVEATVDQGQLAGEAAGVAGGEVVARIDCGKKPLAYVLFGSVYDRCRGLFW